jgi:predicted nucleic acid-binding protein
MILVDTSVWIDFLKNGESREAQKLEQVLEEETDVFTTGLIVQELLSGIKEKRTRTELKRDMERFILVMPTLETHVHAAEIFDECCKRGFTISSNIDCVIAALTIEYDIQLLQKDRDFQHIGEIFPLKLLETE